MSDQVQVTRISPVHVDARGTISDIVNVSLRHVGLITTEKGAVRGNHYHLQSCQYSYILSGVFEATTAPLDQPARITRHILKAGDLIFIPPRHLHRFVAVETAVMVDMISESRAAENYENDVVRVQFSGDRFEVPPGQA